MWTDVLKIGIGVVKESFLYFRLDFKPRSFDVASADLCMVDKGMLTCNELAFIVMPYSYNFLHEPDVLRAWHVNTFAKSVSHSYSVSKTPWIHPPNYKLTDDDCLSFKEHAPINDQSWLSHTVTRLGCIQTGQKPKKMVYTYWAEMWTLST